MATIVTFADYPRATQLRMAAVAVLQAAGTAAGSNVLDTPLDSLDPETTYPVISVTTSTDRSGAAGAGGIPSFRVTYNLHIGCGTVAAVANDATVGNELLAQAARIALFSDPVMMKMLGQIDSVTEKSAGGKGEKRYVVTTELLISTRPVAIGEQYTPNLTSVLLPTGQPQAAPRNVIAPVTEITGKIAQPGQQPADYTPVKTQTLSQD